MSYYVSTYGRIIGKRKELKQRVGPDGYLFVTLGDMNHRTSICTHRIVMDAFCKKPSPKHEVNHIDFDRTNPRIDNLEYITHIENIKYSVDAGRCFERAQGERNPRSKITYNMADEIRKAYSDGDTIASLARKYKIGWTTVSHVLKNETWIKRERS